MSQSQSQSPQNEMSQAQQTEMGAAMSETGLETEDAGRLSGLKDGVGKLRHRVARTFEGAAAQLRPSTVENHGFLDPVRRNVAATLDEAAFRVEAVEWRDVQASTRETIRRHPLTALAAGVGLGLLFGRMLRR
jgi:hypothetical protein